jgi:hypothetical protein
VSREVPKTIYFRSEDYRRYVASFPCFACGIEGMTQAAHSNQSKHGKGKSVKASDKYIFPLCFDHHAQHDLCWEMTRAERNEIEDAYIEKMLAFAHRDGWRFE